MHNLPPKFIERLREQRGREDADALVQALRLTPPTSVRINSYKVGDVAELGMSVRGSIGWCAEGYYLASRPQFTFDVHFHAGAYYVQEAASQFLSHIISSAPNSGLGAKVLDMCAAPGGKTTIYSSAVGVDGLVVANEVDRRRVEVLADNVRRWGVGNVAVTRCESSQFAVATEEFFDVVAIDAPCSGEGMFRKDAGACEEWSEGLVYMCAERQKEILSNGWVALKGGGTLIYSTCTFNREENEGLLEWLTEEFGEELESAERLQIDPEWGVEVGSVGAFQTFRFMPHKTDSEGLFVAVARKVRSIGGGARVGKARKSIIAAADKAATKELVRWLREPERMQVGAIADRYYAWYSSQFESIKWLADRLPIIYSGVAMGQLFKGALRPDHALAMFCALRGDAVPSATLDKERSIEYLRRGTLSTDGFEQGLNLVTCEGSVLGFAKCIAGRVNNMYPNSLKIIKQN